MEEPLIIYLDFRKVSDIIPRNILLSDREDMDLIGGLSNG